MASRQCVEREPLPQQCGMQLQSTIARLRDQLQHHNIQTSRFKCLQHFRNLSRAAGRRIQIQREIQKRPIHFREYLSHLGSKMRMELAIASDQKYLWQALLVLPRRESPQCCFERCVTSIQKPIGAIDKDISLQHRRH